MKMKDGGGECGAHVLISVKHASMFRNAVKGRESNESSEDGTVKGIYTDEVIYNAPGKQIILYHNRLLPLDL